MLGLAELRQADSRWHKRADRGAGQVDRVVRSDLSVRTTVEPSVL